MFVNQRVDKSTLLAAGANKFSTDLVLNGDVYTAAHWGALKVTVKNGKIVKSTNAFEGYAFNNMQTTVGDLINGKRANRIKAPMVRKSYLEKKANNRELRGNDEWVEVSYEQAIKLVADEVAKIRKEKGASGIYGSYGWQSSGKLHSAGTLLHRYLTMGGGFVGGLGDLSTCSSSHYASRNGNIRSIRATNFVAFGARKFKSRRHLGSKPTCNSQTCLHRHRQ